MDWKMTLLNERIKGREEGREEGRIEGREEGHRAGFTEASLPLITIIKTKVQKGADLAEIAEALDTDMDLIRPVWEAVHAAAPDYDQEKILQALLGK